MKTYGFVHLEYGSQHRKKPIEMLGRQRQQLAQEGDAVSLVIVDNALSFAPQHWQTTGFESGSVAVTSWSPAKPCYPPVQKASE